MGEIIRIKKGDYGTPFLWTVRDSSGTAEDISTASSVVLRIGRKGESTTLVNGTMSFNSDGSDGKVTYSFASDDLDTAGYYDSQIRVNFSTGRVTTNDFTLQVVESV